jgi:hypothetical protein
MDAPADLTITIDDIIKAGHCPKGARRSFDAVGADFRAFLKNGMPAAEFIAQGGGNAEQVVARKLERELTGVDLAGITVTAKDAQAAGMCAIGSRRFASRTGLDFSAYLKTGIPAAELVATGDPDALAVVRHKVLSRG